MTTSKVIPLKRFGQNYLTDKNIVRKIINEFSPAYNNVVIEIGPGKGALTEFLVQRLNKLYAVEIDKRVIDDLKNKYKNIEVINTDFLKLDTDNFAEGKNKIRIIGNIPYNITSPIIFKLINQREIISDAVLMIQYEVARRITAKPNSKDYGILSVLLNFFSKAKFCFRVSANAFRPKPKVDSAVIHLFFDKEIPPDIPPKLFIQTVKAAFGNRRKTLRNSLANSQFHNIKFDKLNFDITRRAESLTTEEFIFLTRFIAANAEKTF